MNLEAIDDGQWTIDNENLPLTSREHRGEGRGVIVAGRNFRQENSRLVVETTCQNYNLGFFHLVHEPMFTVYSAGPAACQLES